MKKRHFVPDELKLVDPPGTTDEKPEGETEAAENATAEAAEAVN